MKQRPSGPLSKGYRAVHLPCRAGPPGHGTMVHNGFGPLVLILVILELIALIVGATSFTSNTSNFTSYSTVASNVSIIANCSNNTSVSGLCWFGPSGHYRPFGPKQPLWLQDGMPPK